MRMHNIEMVVLVKDRPIFEYEHNKQFFIEGRAGSNYEIQLRNHTAGRVEAILSVDGLSVIDGKEAGPTSRSYLIDAYGTIKIPGWLLDSGSAAKFAFAGKQDSYAAQSNASRNVGVIGALIYAERTLPYSWSYPQTLGAMPFYMTTSVAGDAMWRNAAPCSASNSSAWTASAAPQSTNQQSLGTAFGDPTAFVTNTVAFQRGHQLAILALYYDNMRGLRARGVPVERSKKVLEPQPNAFPGLVGCAPPQNWRAT